MEPPSCWVYSGKTAATSGSPSATRSTRRLVTIWTWTTPMLTSSTIAEKITYVTISLVSFCECWPYRDCGGVQSPKCEQSMVIGIFWRCDDVYQPGVELFMRTVGGSCKNITQVIWSISSSQFLWLFMQGTEMININVIVGQLFIMKPGQDLLLQNSDRCKTWSNQLWLKF